MKTFPYSVDHNEVCSKPRSDSGVAYFTERIGESVHWGIGDFHRFPVSPFHRFPVSSVKGRHSTSLRALLRTSIVCDLLKFGEPMMVRIGTSGWVYGHWRGRFYPRQLSAADWLPFYASHFDTVEVNNSFYRLPSRQTFSQWARQTPEGFVFSVKGHRFITHMKKLKGIDEPLQRFFSATEGLAEKLAVVLWQLPPNLKADAERLNAFLRALPRHCAHAVEFRHPSWWQDKGALKVLERHGIAHCVPIVPPLPKELADIVTAPVVYLRFHGWDGLYSGCFPEDELSWWAERIKKWRRQDLTVFAYFNNDVNAYAVQNAQTLKRLVEDL